MFPLPTYSEVIDKAVSADKLKETALAAGDPDISLGLAFLAKTGESVRQELSDLVLEAKPDYAPTVTVLKLTMDGVDQPAVARLI